MTEDAKSLLLRAKDMTRRTGTLVEAQMLQLRLWPQVVFKDVLDVTIDPLDIEGKTVNYMLRMSKPPKGKDLAKRAAALEDWLRSLLGDDWMLVIKTRQKKGGPGRLLHRGTRKAPLDNEPAMPVADLKAYEFKTPVTDYRRYRLRDIAAASAEVAKPLPPIDLKEKKP
jgi:hypothetical protein